MRSMAVRATISDVPVRKAVDVSPAKICVFQVLPVRVCKAHQRTLEFVLPAFHCKRTVFETATTARLGFAGELLPSQGEAGTSAGCGLRLVSKARCSKSPRGLFVSRAVAL